MLMAFYLLDAGGAGLVLAVLIIFMIAAVTLEGLIMGLMKYNPFGKAFADALIINLVSLGGGFLLIEILPNGLDFSNNEFLNYFILYALTVAVEFFVLYLLNRDKEILKTLLAAIVINIVSYLVLFLLQYF
jgi:hypothetical protein